jgi:integrase
MSPRKYDKGSIYQRQSDGRWIGALTAGFTERNTRRRVSVTGKTKGEVERRLRDKRAEMAKASGQVSPGANLRRTVKSWIDEWLPIRQALVRPATYAVDTAAVRWMLPVFGAKRLVDLTPRDVRAYHARQRTAQLAVSTINRHHRVLRKMLRDARQEGLVVPDNVLEVPAVPEGETDRVAMSTAQALTLMHHAVDLPHGSRYFVAFYQGLRQGEALGLTWDSIDFGANTITVEWQLQALPYLDRLDRSQGFRVPDAYTARHLVGRFHLVRPKTRRSHRVIPMVDEIREALIGIRQTGRETVGNLVWVRDNGWPIDKRDDADEFRRLQTAAGVKHPTGRPYFGHEMRNTTATLLLESGVDPVTITAILGHSDWATSVGYMSARPEQMRAAMEGIAAAFRPKVIG